MSKLRCLYCGCYHTKINEHKRCDTCEKQCRDILLQMTVKYNGAVKGTFKQQ